MSHSAHQSPRRAPRDGGSLGRLGAAAALVVVLAGIAVLATIPDQPALERAKAGAEREPVTRAVLACPPGRADAVVKAGSAAGLPGPGEPDGGSEIRAVQLDAESRVVAVDRGELDLMDADADGVLVRGEGPAAYGMLAVRGERTGTTLAAGGCLAPRPSWWFAGAGGGVDHSSVLFLTNPDEGPAVVDVQLHGATGSVDTAGTRGLTVPPGEAVRLELAEVAPGSDELTVQVTASRGRVVAHVLDSLRLEGGEGREWVPAAPSPKDDVVLPGVPAGADRVQLLVTNPREEQAVVDLEVLTGDGAFVPLGLEQLSVDPGTIEVVDLTEAMEGRSGAVRLRAEVPVTGVVRSVVAGDVVHGSAAAPITEPAGLAVVGDRTEMQVVAGEQAVTLELLFFRANGDEALRQPITVPPSGLTQVSAPPGTAYAVLLPGSGRGFAAAVHRGSGVAVQPAALLPTTLRRPAVVPYTGGDGVEP